MNGLILRCTTLCVPSSIRKRNDGGIRIAMMIVLDMPVATIIMVTTMMIMVVSDISVMAVGGMSARQRVRQGVCDLAKWGARCGEGGSHGYFGDLTGHLQETSGRVGGERADRYRLAKNGGGDQAGRGTRGYSVLGPYGAKKLVCGRSWCQHLDTGRFFGYLFGTMRFH